MDFKQWEGFSKNRWNKEINVSDFIKSNYTLYEGDASFLAGATERTERVNKKVKEL